MAAISLTAVLAACSHQSHLATHKALADTTTTTESTSTSSSTTTEPTTTTTTRPLPGIGVGAKGPAVLALKKRLDALHYDVGSIDSSFDGITAYAVTAFQKVTGMARTGRATDDVLAAMATAVQPAAEVPGGGANRVEVDLPRQVLFLYEGNVLSKILPVSTGSGQRFCIETRCERAVTPGGSYRIYRRYSGWEISPLGRLYNSQYFNSGIAIHGALSVPAYPASHGCVRIPMNAAEWFPAHVSYGTPVYVSGGPVAPAPFADIPPVPDTTPTTLKPLPTPSTLLPPITLVPTPTTAPPTTTTPTTRVPTSTTPTRNHTGP